MKPDRINSSRLLSSLALATTLGCGALASGETYLPIRIPVPSGAVSVNGSAGINNDGTIVGGTTIKSGRSLVSGPAFVSVNGTSSLLPSLNANVSSLAFDISDTGLIVGATFTTPRRATWWQRSSDGTYTVGDWNSHLPADSLFALRVAKAVSSDGQYVAFEAEDLQTGRALGVLAEIGSGGPVFWTIPTIGDPPVAVESSSFNDVQAVDGIVRLTGSFSPGGGFSWELNKDTGAVSMQSLASPVSGGSVVCRSINAAGVVAGFGFLDPSSRSIGGLLWGTDGSPFALPTLGGSTTANSINNSNSVVGGSNALVRKNTYSEHAFIWQPATGMRDLNALKSSSDTSGIELISALKINDAGQILATGQTKAGYSLVLLQPMQ